MGNALLFFGENSRFYCMQRVSRALKLYDPIRTSVSGEPLSSTTGQNETYLHARQLDLRLISTESRDSELMLSVNSSSCIALQTYDYSQIMVCSTQFVTLSQHTTLVFLILPSRVEDMDSGVSHSL